MPTEPDLSGVVTGLYVGQPQPLWPGRPSSAIKKYPVEGAAKIDGRGFVGDQQADLKVHGGADKAVHHYAEEHLEYWKVQFPEHAAFFQPGCFGENITTTGFNEQGLCIGDVLTVGTAKVQITQGRQPCWKLNAHTGINEMAAQFQQTAYTGWYYRVVEAGSVSVGERMALIDRVHPDWTVHKVTKARFNPHIDGEAAKTLSSLTGLSESWRAAFMKKADRLYRENTDARLKGA
ncbi:MAG: MOSC domain-containing protein [Pseudomonadota bacterium]